MRRALSGNFSCAGSATRIALAVSGGSDSMALLHLARNWADECGVTLTVFTVDHGLRSESASEAEFVARRCAALALPHHILTWSGRADGGNLSEQAREARYRLMATACDQVGAEALMTGHTADDQAETVLMRLARGSGVDGLAAMAPESHLWGMRVLRPLLSETREALRAALLARGETWIEDPTNNDAAYDRVKARTALEALAPLGLTTARLNRTARMMALAREALDRQADALAGKALRFKPPGYAVLAPHALMEAPLETALRSAARVLAQVSGEPRRPRLDRLETMLDWLGGAPREGGRSLGGTLWAPDRAGRIMVSREPAAAALSVPVEDMTEWDGRFRLRLSSPQQGLMIGALGESGLAVLKAEGHEDPADWRAAPRAARLSSPAIWRGERLIAAPHAGWRAKDANFETILASIAPGMNRAG